ncbi:MAG: PP2C family protein-serine/threonine phosphatase, partial [Actinomycetota bacterium]
GDTLASAVLITLDPGSGEVRMCSAGHPPVIVVGTQEVSLRRPTGPLLYLGSQSEYEETSFELSAGDSVVAFSDGVADVQVVKDERTEPELLADRLLAEGSDAARTADLVLGFADPEPSDDQTVMVIRRSS